MALGKGDRIRVISGRQSMNATGTIFWVGDNKYGEGNRFGIHGDDGETHWIPEEHCELWTEAPVVADGPALNKGDRVEWTDNDQASQGEVFWLGANKYGPGTRVGVKDDSGETHWFDSRKLTVAAKAAGRVQGTPAERWGDVPPAAAGGASSDEVWDGRPMASSPDTPPQMDEPPPIDDAFAHYSGESDDAEIYDDEVPF